MARDLSTLAGSEPSLAGEVGHLAPAIQRDELNRGLQGIPVIRQQWRLVD
jgi:hypothetical protein